MAAFKTFEEINAWKDGRELVKAIYSVTGRRAFAQDYGLRDQLQRAAVSICSNIAEGFERRGNKEFIKFLWIAKGSAAEVASQLHHARDLDYITSVQIETLYGEAKKIAAMIYKLISSIPNPERIRL